jgi:hypothetical protein
MERVRCSWLLISLRIFRHLGTEPIFCWTSCWTFCWTFLPREGSVIHVKIFDSLVDDINGKPPPKRWRIRSEHSRLLVTDLERWLREQRAKLSASNQVAKGIAYIRLCLSPAATS